MYRSDAIELGIVTRMLLIAAGYQSPAAMLDQGDPGIKMTASYAVISVLALISVPDLGPTLVVARTLWSTDCLNNQFCALVQ